MEQWNTGKQGYTAYLHQSMLAPRHNYLLAPDITTPLLRYATNAPVSFRQRQLTLTTPGGRGFTRWNKTVETLLNNYPQSIQFRTHLKSTPAISYSSSSTPEVEKRK